jgi:WD40 repeat protein
VVADGLTNPAFVSFRPGTGNVTICDSGKGRVLMIEDGLQKTIVDGMDTEFWKTLPDGSKAYKVGVQAALWLSPQRLIITDGGKPDGQETVAVYHISSLGPAKNTEKVRTNTIGPTGGGDTDKGEGNLSGVCLMPDGRTLYVCSHGNDTRSWVLKADLQTGKLETALSADEHGIEVNAPMQALPWRGNLLVSYSGAGGKDDGLIVEWDLASGKPVNQWRMTGMPDPMGMALIPGTANQFAVTNNNWRLDGVNRGTVAIVTLEDKPLAETQVIARGLLGPVHCAFGPDSRLYVTCLGAEYDKDEGLVIAISGFSG